MKTYGQIAYESYHKEEYKHEPNLYVYPYSRRSPEVRSRWEKAAEAVIDAFLAYSVAPQEGYNNETSPQENPIRTSPADS